jgi:hypothetical protein
MKNDDMDVDKMMFTRKVDLDYIPGLDDDLKVILPASFEASLANTLEEKFEQKEGKKEAKKNENKPEEDQQEEENDPKSITPHSSMFIFGPDNWYFL